MSDLLAEAIGDLEFAFAKAVAVLDPEYARSKREWAANEACWAVLLAMGLGLLNEVPMDNRPWLAKPMKSWADWEFALHRVSP